MTVFVANSQIQVDMAQLIDENIVVVEYNALNLNELLFQ
jgi:hypothetical protein